MKNIYALSVFFLIAAGFGNHLSAQNPTDLCSGAPSLSVNASCVNTAYTQAATHTVTVPNPSCATNYRDSWYKFTATTTSTTITASTNRDLAIVVYSGTCASLTEIACANAAGFGGSESTTFGTAIGTTYYVALMRVNNAASNTMTGNICIVGSTPPANDDPCSATALTVGGSCSYTAGNNNGASNSTGIPAPGCASYSGQDVWYTCTVPASGFLNITLETGTITDGGAALYTGTCGSLTLFSCDDDGAGSSGLMPYFNLSCVTPGTQIWIRVWQFGGGTGTFQICAYNPGGSCTPPANDDPCSATALTVAASCSYATYTNQNAGPSVGVPAPGCAGYSGGDVWFTATVPASGNLNIDTQTGVVLDGGMAAYSGTCGSLTLISCDDDASANGAMPYLSLTCLTPGTTIWIRFWEYGNDNDGTFGICVTDPGASGSTPANDLPCNATSLSLSVTTTGNNTNATNCNEPADPGCWVNGTNQSNTVWFSVVCPASGQLDIRTGLGTLTNTQIEVFSGTCSSLTSIGCSNNVTLCGNTQNWSEVDLTGLTPGATYYVRVDGHNGQVGDFSITAIDGTSSWPPVFGQDCQQAMPVCSSTSTIGDPGFIGSGNYCDYPGNATGCPGGSCIYVGERNSVWYSFTIGSNGTLSFTLTPNTPCDYDFALYDVSGNPNGCTDIASNS
ncbi:MAG TPA: hypothetical protein VFU15_03830, partial [Bacteroidia bacterium]|nr:hypothetical protein [Bacteroidia bacterium]